MPTPRWLRPWWWLFDRFFRRLISFIFLQLLLLFFFWFFAATSWLPSRHWYTFSSFSCLLIFCCRHITLSLLRHYAAFCFVDYSSLWFFIFFLSLLLSLFAFFVIYFLRLCCFRCHDAIFTLFRLWHHCFRLLCCYQLPLLPALFFAAADIFFFRYAAIFFRHWSHLRRFCHCRFSWFTPPLFSSFSSMIFFYFFHAIVCHSRQLPLI